MNLLNGTFWRGTEIRLRLVGITLNRLMIMRERRCKGWGTGSKDCRHRHPTQLNYYLSSTQ